jgi:uncharacterized protein
VTRAAKPSRSGGVSNLMGQPSGMDVIVAGAGLVADCEGALYWPEQGMLVLADLHLEKGSSFAARGVLLPPYDTAATLARMARVIARYAPRAVVALGDSFHDGEGPDRMGENDRAALARLQRGREWIWILGNHDVAPRPGIGGRFVPVLAVDRVVFRHEPSGAQGEIAGHLHPRARVAAAGCVISRRCFAGDGTRLVMPAFGAYAGLNVRHRAFGKVFGTFAFTAHLLGAGRLYSFAASSCLND